MLELDGPWSPGHLQYAERLRDPPIGVSSATHHVAKQTRGRAALGSELIAPNASSEFAWSVNGRRDSETHRRDVFTVIFYTHAAAVRRHVESHLSDDQDVDEVVADVFRIAWQKLDPRRPLGWNWLLRTAQNKLQDRERSFCSRERALAALRCTAQGRKAGQNFVDSIAVRDALDALSDKERRIIVLTYWYELSAGEIAENLKTSQGAVWTTLSRARTKLRWQLTDDPVEVAKDRHVVDTVTRQRQTRE